MTRILMRGGKSPFKRVSYEDTLARNTLGTNSGNLIFAESVWKTLSTKDAKITMNGYSANPDKADYINAHYDVFVLPFANAFRPSFLQILDKFSALIERLTIPVVVTGVGAQTSLDGSAKYEEKMREPVTRFCKAVLARSGSIGVRGEYTYQFLRNLGFDEDQVDIIGCPSMFYYGPDFPNVTKKGSLLQNSKLRKQDKISMNVSPYVPGIDEIFERNYKRYKKLVYVPQNNESLDQILWNGAYLKEPGRVFPKTTQHPMFKEDRLRFFIDPKTWLNHFKGYRFVFGTRIHGNIMALLAGVPAFVLAHDSRTLELVRYFEIPHMRMDELPENVVAEDLFEIADYTNMLSGHQKRFDTWVGFLDKNGLKHVHNEGEDGGNAFAEKMAKARLPGEMRTLPNQPKKQLYARTLWGVKDNMKRLNKLKK